MSQTFPQTAFEDAQFLLKNTETQRVKNIIIIEIGSDTNPEALRILKKYATPAETPKVQTDFNNNPFVNISGLPENSDVWSKAGRLAGESLKGLGGLDVTNFSDGLARFLVARMKEELNVMFFDRFNKFLEDQPDAQALFPKTYSIMLLARDRIYDFQTYLPALREAFEQDFSGILQHADTWLGATPKDKSILKFLSDKPVILASVQLGIKIALKVENGDHPGDVLHEIKDLQLLTNIHANVKPALQTADLFSQTLRSNNPDRYWITREQLKAFEDETFAQIYLGLIYQQAWLQNITFSNKSGEKVRLDAIMALAAKEADGIKRSIENTKNFLIEIQNQVSQIDEAVAAIRRNSERIDPAFYFTLVQNISNLAVSVTQLPVLKPIFETPANGADQFEEIKFYIEHSANLLTDIQARSYSAAVFEVALILEHACGEKCDEIKSIKVFTNGFIKYGTFMATVASASNAEEVQQAIEAVALPPGSARIKRSTPFNISVNSYLGFHYGNEYLEESSGWSTIVGFSAPVGVAFNFGLLNNNGKKTAGSLSVFATLIDIGAVASVRLKDDTTEELPEIELENIIAPGIYGVYGFWKLPISVGYGWQQGPQLRSVNVSDPANPGGFKNELKNGYRWSFFVAVDIPLINLYTKTR